MSTYTAGTFAQIRLNTYVAEGQPRREENVRAMYVANDTLAPHWQLADGRRIYPTNAEIQSVRVIPLPEETKKAQDKARDVWGMFTDAAGSSSKDGVDMFPEVIRRLLGGGSVGSMSKDDMADVLRRTLDGIVKDAQKKVLQKEPERKGAIVKDSFGNEWTKVSDRVWYSPGNGERRYSELREHVVELVSPGKMF